MRGQGGFTYLEIIIATMILAILAAAVIPVAEITSKRAKEMELRRNLRMIRNAIDHGIETPAERKALGKPARGRIVFEARHESRHVLGQIKDDGRGIDKKDIENRAVQAGVSIEGEKSYKDLIFLPGLSTAQSVTSSLPPSSKWACTRI